MAKKKQTQVEARQTVLNVLRASGKILHMETARKTRLFGNREIEWGLVLADAEGALLSVVDWGVAMHLGAAGLIEQVAHEMPAGLDREGEIAWQSTPREEYRLTEAGREMSRA